MFADGLSKASDLANLIYFTLGILIFWAGSKAWRGTAAKSSNNQALNTIEILKANIEAVKEQAKTQKEADERIIGHQTKQIDDLGIRLKKAEETIQTLSTIPWERQQQNHSEVMKAVSSISEGIDKLVDFLDHNQQTTTVMPSGKIVVKPNK